MKVRYFVQQQQMMALRRDLTMPWWMKLLGFRDQWKWVGSFGQALAIDAGELILFRAADDIDRYAKAGTEMPFLTRARIRLDCAQGVRHCLDGVEVLFKASGAAGIRTSSPLTRAVADLRAINQHGLLSLEMNQELYGRILLGLEPNTPLI